MNSEFGIRNSEIGSRTFARSVFRIPNSESRLFRSCCLLLTACCLLLVTPAWGQPAVAVQLPTFSFFSTNTAVSVPDRGSAYLGGVRRAQSDLRESGVPLLPLVPFRNRGSSSATAPRRGRFGLHPRLPGDGRGDGGEGPGTRGRGRRGGWGKAQRAPRPSCGWCPGWPGTTAGLKSRRDGPAAARRPGRSAAGSREALRPGRRGPVARESGGGQGLLRNRGPPGHGRTTERTLARLQAVSRRP